MPATSELPDIVRARHRNFSAQTARSSPPACSRTPTTVRRRRHRRCLQVTCPTSYGIWTIIAHVPVQHRSHGLHVREILTHHVEGPLSTTLLSSLGAFIAPCDRPPVHYPPFQFGRLHRAVWTPPSTHEVQDPSCKVGRLPHTLHFRSHFATMFTLFLFSRVTHFSLQFSLGAYNFLFVRNIFRIVLRVCTY